MSGGRPGRVTLRETSLQGVPRRQGKVRDVFDLGDRLLLVATDRISAFDWVLPTGIPDKGRVLTALSAFWFNFLGVPNHLISIAIEDVKLDIDRRDARVAPRTLDAGSQGAGGSVRVRGPRLPLGQRMERVPQGRLGLRHQAPLRGSSRATASSRSSRRPPRRRPATMRTSRST